MELEYNQINDLIKTKQVPVNSLPELIGRRIGFSKPSYPGFYHIHYGKDYAVKFMDESCCTEFNTTLEEIQSIGRNFQQLVTHPNDLLRVKKLLQDLRKTADEQKVCSYVQRIKLRPEKIEGYTLVITSVRYIPKEDLFICMTNTTDQLPIFSKKTCNVLNSNYDTKTIAKRYLTLTKREREVFSFIVEGLYVKEIAIKLFRSERTIEQHKKNIYKKLQINTKAEAIQLKIWLSL